MVLAAPVRLAVVVRAEATGEKAEPTHRTQLPVPGVGHRAHRVGDRAVEPAVGAGADAAENRSLARSLAQEIGQAELVPDQEQEPRVAAADIDDVALADVRPQVAGRNLEQREMSRAARQSAERRI